MGVALFVPMTYWMEPVPALASIVTMVACAIFAGDIEDLQGLRWKHAAMEWAGAIGLGLLWIAAGLTLVTGVDYLMKSIPFLKDENA